MSEYKRQRPDYDCPPSPPRDPADQPNPPGAEKCQDPPTTEPPKLDPPPPCPEPDCDCPDGGGGADSNCLENLIARQAAEIARAAKAAAFKTDLEAILTKARVATLDYTRPKYEGLVRRWVEQDAAVAELVRRLVCALPCWRCVVECYICPILNKLHYAERWLYGDGTLYNDVHNLYDLQYWLTRDRDAKDRRFQRIKRVLQAWETPNKTIDAILTSNQLLIDSAGKVIGSDPGKAVYDVFLKLVPLDLAIAPPKGSQWSTRIAREFTDFCGCDVGRPDDCCGPDAGELSLRQRLTGPQPYLIDPARYYDVICCLVEKRYHPAKDALAKAEADLADVNSRINSYKTQLDTWTTTFERDAKGAIPGTIDCCDFEPDDDDNDKRRQTAR